MQSYAQKVGALTMQTPEAESVGTSTNLEAASKILLLHFDQMSRRGDRLSLEDLRSDLTTQTIHGDEKTQDATRFFIASPIARILAGETEAGGLTRSGLASAAQRATDPRLDEQLVSLGDRGRQDPERFYSLVLRDPGIPNSVRARIIVRLGDDRLLRAIGRPIVAGTEQDKRDVTTAFLYLARLSWLGAAEAEAIVTYKVPYTMLRGDKDHSASYWNNHAVQISEKMISGGSGVVNDQALAAHIGVFAHESGHGIFSLSGLQKIFNADLVAHHITHGMDGIVNEAVAGVFQNRAHVAALGYGTNEDSDSNLAIIHDVEKNIAAPNTMYALYYHVDVNAAQAQLPVVRQIIADDLIPFFQNKFGLLGDPQLTSTLPPSHR